MISEGTIIANSSAPGSAAISVIRLSGEDSIKIVNSFFKPKNNVKLIDAKSHTVNLGILNDGKERIDEVLVSVFKSPKSYTGENLVEISCHGSNYIQEKILKLFIENNVTLAKPGEFTLRAFLNKKLDLTQAEAVADLIKSDTQAAHEIALNQMRGGYSKEVKNLRSQLLNFASLIELELDFSEEDVEFADRNELNNLLDKIETKLRVLIDSFSYGRAIKNGVPVAIIGKPNSGKSSLLNKLLNENKAIVSDIPGTTRDLIEDTLTINGIQFRFIDTAGLRKSNDKIESIGISKAIEVAQKAKIILYLIEANDNDDDSIKEAFKSFNSENVIIIPIFSKIDLEDKNERNTVIYQKNKKKTGLDLTSSIEISIFDDLTIRNLKEHLFNRTSNLKSSSNNTIVSNVRHYSSMKDSLKSIKNIKKGLKNQLSVDLLSVDIKQALNSLGEITGEITNEEVLGNIFKNFCIGK
tara:strand:+ start:1170 stop:2573 length:1404 start_codon:yes stop_codon:yes gene_type:complete